MENFKTIASVRIATPNGDYFLQFFSNYLCDIPEPDQ